MQLATEGGPGAGQRGATRSRVTWGIDVTPVRAGDFRRLPGFYLVFTGEGAAVAGPVDLPGYPQLTGQTERKIFGEDLLRLHGMDAQVMRANLAGGAS